MKKRKLPIEGDGGRWKATKEAMVSLVVEVPKKLKRLPTEEYTSYWKEINDQLDSALFPEGEWIKEQMEKGK